MLEKIWRIRWTDAAGKEQVTEPMNQPRAQHWFDRVRGWPDTYKDAKLEKIPVTVLG